MSTEEFKEALDADVVIPVESSSPPGSIPQAMEARRLYDERRIDQSSGLPVAETCRDTDDDGECPQCVVMTLSSASGWPRGHRHHACPKALRP